MSLVSPPKPSTTSNSLLSSTEVDDDNDTLRSTAPSAPSTTETTEATLSTLLGAFASTNRSSMDRGPTEYSQSGLHSPYPHAFSDTQSEEPPADHASAAQYTSQQEGRPIQPAAYSSTSSATPQTEYGVYPAPARPQGSFPEHHLQRQYHPASNHSGSSGGMAQSTNPTIAASSPTYPQHGGQYSPYPPQHDMSQQGYPAHQPPGGLYQQARPDWAGYAGHPQQHPMQGGYAVTGAQTPTSAAPAGQRPGQVYSFVPIPGAQQHKRPRRRYEEIERMYKCGWNGCEKAYGTLNHLNAHVTMQSHGTKRTPEEFKEIRKEWKARKKEEENARKAEDERQRQAAAPTDGQAPADGAPAPGYQQAARSVQLPPIGYQPGAQVPGQYQAAPSGNLEQVQQYGNNHLQYSGYPASPYGAPNQI